MFAALFVFTLVSAYVTAELPSFIHPCGRKDPNYDQCITNNINDWKDKICTGSLEANIPPIEPITFDKLVIFDTDTTKLYLRNSKVYGLCDFVVNSIHADPDKFHYEFDLKVKQLQVNTTYEFGLHILMPIAHKGLVEITTDNARIKAGLDLKKITKNGKKYIYVSKINMNCDIKTFNYKFNENEKELIQLHEILNDIVTKNEKELISKVIPVLENETAKQIISPINNLLSTRYDELFPERT